MPSIIQIPHPHESRPREKMPPCAWRTKRRRGVQNDLGNAMRTTLTVCVLLLLLTMASVARAQGPGPVFAGGAPVLEGGIGYSYMGTDIPSNGSSLGMNGLLLTGNADFGWHLGVKVEAGYNRAFDAFGTGHSADMLTYMGGPVFYPIRNHKYNLFAQALAGAARETGVNVDNSGALVMGYTNRFAWSAGLGGQYRVTPALSLRIAAEYLRTTFYNTDLMLKGQSNIRSSLSVVYTFGSRE
jgi:opacity protein-like surface antigen